MPERWREIEATIHLCFGYTRFTNSKVYEKHLSWKTSLWVKQNAAVLRCFPYDVSHTSFSIANTLHMIVSDWKFKEKLHLILCGNALSIFPECTWILCEKTRWNYYYDMFVRLLQQKRAIRCAEDDININVVDQLTPNDLMLIPRIINLLRPFANATLNAEYENTFISDTVPLIKKIYYQLNAIHQIGIGTMRIELVYKWTDISGWRFASAFLWRWS